LRETTNLRRQAGQTQVVKLQNRRAGMGFPVRTKGTRNTEHMFSLWGLVGIGNREEGTSQSRAKRDAPQGRRRLNFAASAAKFFFENR
jgi:hypothetical protein